MNRPVDPSRPRFCRKCLPVLILAAFLLLPPAGFAGQPDDFEARLELHRNGKPLGEMHFSLASQDGRWTMASETTGTRGLARFLGLEEASRSEGDWTDGAPRPAHYERRVKAVRTLRWSAEFDWERGAVHSVYPDGEATLELEPGTLDDSALGLAIRAGLQRGEREWQLRLLDEDEIEDARFVVRGVDRIDTALGCMTVHNVEKMRGGRSKRYTRTYYAAEHAFAPVLLQHGKEGGDHVEGRVVELRVGGEPVPVAPACGK